MTAPGESLEFQASVAFRARVVWTPMLLEKIKNLLKHSPDAGAALCDGIKELEFDCDGEAFVLFLARRGNRFSLMYVYQAIELASIQAKRKELLAARGKGGLR